MSTRLSIRNGRTTDQYGRTFSLSLPKIRARRAKVDHNERTPAVNKRVSVVPLHRCYKAS